MRIRSCSNPFKGLKCFEPFEPQKHFATFTGTLDVEIGFGQSSFIVDYATAHHQRCIVGIEILVKAVSLMQQKVTDAKLDNIHLINGNGAQALRDAFADQSLDRIFIFHPTPWIKQRHLKRRLINQALIETAQKKLKPDGCVYFSTDVKELWEEVGTLFAQHEAFVTIEDNDFWTNYYSTRWHEMSKEKNRETFYATFCLQRS